MSADILPIDPERFRLTPEQVKRITGNTTKEPARAQFARVWLPWLTDRNWDAIFPPRPRLWLFLLIKSKEGRRPVRLSNELAKEIGLDRYAKRRALAWLNRAGLVSVTQSGKESPLVIVVADPAGCGLKRNRVWAETQQGVVSNAHQSGESISTYLSTLISNNESYNEADPPPARWALFDLPSQPLDPRPPIPDPTRDAVYARADGACEQCRRAAPLELHHLHYNTQGDELPDDLQALCRECHDSRHRDLLGKFWVDPVELRHFWGVNPMPAEGQT